MDSLNIVFTQPGNIQLLRQPVTAPKDNEILCKASRSLISVGTECTCLRGVFDPGTNWSEWVKYPFRPGYSMVSKVLEVGKSVKRFKVGDRVYTSSPHSQYPLCAEDKAHLLPEGISDEDATWTSLMRTSQNGVRKAQIQMGDCVVVIGLGQIGLLTLQYARIAGASRIIAIDPIEKRVKKATGLGATDILCARADAPETREKIAQWTSRAMADIVFETTGNPLVLASACTLVRKCGKIGLVGDTAEPSKQALGPGVVSNSLTIFGAHTSLFASEPNVFYPWTREKIQEIAFTYILQKRFSVSEMVTRHESPLKAPDVYTNLLNDQTSDIGIIFDWNI